MTEPHGNIPDLGYTCDALIMPCVAQRIGAYPLVNGVPEAVAAAERLQPKLFIPLANAEIDQSGALAAVLSEDGTVEALAQQLAAKGLATRVETMKPYVPLALQEPQSVAMASYTAQVSPLEKLKSDVSDFFTSVAPKPSAKAQIQALKVDLPPCPAAAVPLSHP